MSNEDYIEAQRAHEEAIVQTLRKPNPQSIVITGRRWFNRRVGNTYFSAQAFIDGKSVEGISYEYGYGQQYEDSMFQKLGRDGLLPEPIPRYDNGIYEPAWRYCERLGITYSKSVTDVQRKKDL